MKILLMAALFLASVMAMSTTVSTPAHAVVYWCKDGTQVSNKKSCDGGGHGGCCQVRVPHAGDNTGDNRQRAVPVDAKGRNK